MKLIVVTGPSGSGKTFLSRQIQSKFKNAAIISTDNYYKTGTVSKFYSKIVNCYFDRKISFNYSLLDQDLNFILKNGFSNFSYHYDFKKKFIKKYKKKNRNIKLVIVEGIFATEIIKKFSHRINLLIKLKPSREVCMKRVLERDVVERGKSKINAQKDFSKGWELFNRKEKTNNYSKITNQILIDKKVDVNLISRIINKYD